ncbi:MAG TPA: tetratricopeptide repeat protein [Flavobacterium sp.]|jgi:tetratricopeptide (TPR) repeat protein
MKVIIINTMMLLAFAIYGQEKDKTLPQGNEKFIEEKYADAEADYRISQSKIASKSIASYNLGNSIYRQNQASESKTAYRKAIESSKSFSEKHLAFHNLGNVYMKEKKYQEAVEAYKNALRNNPSDEQTRYNYALAKQFLKDNPPPKDDKKKDKKDDKKDNKDKKDPKDDKKDQKDQKDDKGDKKDEPKKEENKDGKPKEQPRPKPKESGISKQRLDNLLEAVNNEEKKTQEKINAKKTKGKPIKTDKDW